MTSVELYEGGAAEWDGFAATQTGRTHCHRLGWKRVIEDVLGHRHIALCVRDGAGELTGALPLVLVRSFLTGRSLVSMPFLSYGGPLGDAGTVQLLTDHACELARREGARRLELRSRGELPIDLAASKHKVSAILDLPAGGVDPLFAGFSGKLRSQIRRAEREGLTVSFGASQARAFHSVFSEHMTTLGTPTYSSAFFEEIGEAFGEDAWFGCVYLDGEPIAAGLALRWGDEVEMTWASALGRYSRIAPNMLLYWSFLKRAAEEGLARFDFGRCTPGSGSHRFKQQWGTRDVPLWWYGYSPSGASGSTSSDLGAAGWAPRIWKKLPIPIARVVGPPIRRAIPL